MATDVSKDVIKLHCEDDQQKDWPIIPIVRHVAEIAERASEKSEPEHTQADALNVAFRLIGDQATGGNQRHSQGKQRNKESIPIVQFGKSKAENTDNDDETDRSFSKQTGDSGVFAIAEKTDRGDCENRPESARENWNENQQHQPNPGAIAIPKFLSLVGSALGRSCRDENQKRCQQKQSDHCKRQDDGDRIVKSMTKPKQPLPCHIVHLKACAIRFSLRTIVIQQPTIITPSPRLITPTSNLSKCKICHGRGTTAEYRQITVITSIRCCFAIGPQNSLGAPAIFPAART